MFDCIVIGSGPSGISAAIYLKRFGLDVLVIGKDFGTLSINTKIENYYGIESIDGVDLIKKGLLQAFNLGISVLGILVFSILTMVDIKAMYNLINYSENKRSASIAAAFSLYLDFINIFLYVLRILLILGKNIRNNN